VSSDYSAVKAMPVEQAMRECSGKRETQSMLELTDLPVKPETRESPAKVASRDSKKMVQTEISGRPDYLVRPPKLGQQDYSEKTADSGKPESSERQEYLDSQDSSAQKDSTDRRDHSDHQEYLRKQECSARVHNHLATDKVTSRDTRSEITHTNSYHSMPAAEDRDMTVHNNSHSFRYSENSHAFLRRPDIHRILYTSLHKF
jgi:hypothetical protein